MIDVVDGSSIHGGRESKRKIQTILCSTYRQIPVGLKNEPVEVNGQTELASKMRLYLKKTTIVTRHRR